MIHTLGPGVVRWIEENLAAPDGRGGLVRLNREQREFLYRWYAVDEHGRRIYRRALHSGPKGKGRSPLAAFMSAAEALGPVRWDGLNAEGVPIGRPWSTERTPLVQVAAVSEAQTRNVWSVLQEAIGDGPAGELPGVHVGSTRIDLPGRGRIEYITAGAASKEGARSTFVVLDQVESWLPGVRGPQLAAVLRRNAAKAGGHTVELANAYRPGQRSVAEASFGYWDDIRAGRAVDEGLLVIDDRAPSSFDLERASEAEILAALRGVYGCSAAPPHGCDHPDCPTGWVDLARIVREVLDIDTAVEDSLVYYFGRPTSPARAFISASMLDAITVSRQEAS